MLVQERAGGPFDPGSVMAKRFRTADGSAVSLRSRGVIADDGTKPAIERESYCAMIDGCERLSLTVKL